jgi:hypothetical protein
VGDVAQVFVWAREQPDARAAPATRRPEFGRARLDPIRSALEESGMRLERRSRCSNDFGTALGYQLTACAERAGVELMLIASADGLVVAASDGDEGDSEEVAARLAALSLCTESHGELWRPGRTVAARGFELDGEALIVCAAGRDTSAAEHELVNAIRGARRILGEQRLAS